MLVILDRRTDAYFRAFAWAEGRLTTQWTADERFAFPFTSTAGATDALSRIRGIDRLDDGHRSSRYRIVQRRVRFGVEKPA